MKKLTRKLDLLTFPSNFIGAGKEAMELDLLMQTREKIKGTREGYSYKSWRTAKDNLIEESNGKCAYCEVNFDSVAYGDVEHFRPKSVYWWLAYAYVNYSPSCQLCNQKYKGKKFPIKNRIQTAPVTITANTTDLDIENMAGTLAPDPFTDIELFKQSHIDEGALALDPYIDEPSLFFAYEYDDEIKETIITPSAPMHKERVETCIKLFGLDRLELNRLRWNTLYQYRIFREMVETSDNPRLQAIAKSGIAEMSSDRGQFCGMINFFDKINIDYIDLEDEHQVIL